MATETATVEKASEAAPAADKKKRVRRVYRLGVSSPLKEYEGVPDSKLEAIPEDWELSGHKELRADDFSDILIYFQWVQSYGEQLIEAASTKISELEAYGDADTRAEMVEILGNYESATRALAGTMSKDGMTQSQKDLMDEQVKAILAKVLGG